MLLSHSQTATRVGARAQRELVRDSEIERDAVGLSRHKNHVIGKRRLGDRHAEGHEAVNRLRGILLDKTRADGCNAGEDDVKAIERSISQSLSDGLAADRRASCIDFGSEVPLDLDIESQQFLGGGRPDSKPCLRGVVLCGVRTHVFAPVANEIILTAKRRRKLKLRLLNPRAAPLPIAMTALSLN